MTETLIKSLRPSWCDETIKCYLTKYTDPDDAIASLLNENEDNKPKLLLPTHANDFFDMIKVASVERAAPTVMLCVGQPTTTTSTFMDINNGDCLPAALVTSIAIIAKQPMKAKATLNYYASKCRELILRFQWLNWENRSSTDALYHDLIAMAHNQAITSEEQQAYGFWPTDMEGRFEKWIQERDELYFTTSELVSFYDMVHCMGIKNILLRCWRKHKRQLICLQQIPESVDATKEYIVIDLLHSGGNDTTSAHYQLLKSGSFSSLCKKRKRVQR